MKYIRTIVRLVFLAIFVFLLATGNMMLWLGLFAVSLIFALLFGRIYCGYVCPMNTVMIPAEWISKKLNTQTGNTPKWLRNGYIAWITLVVSIVSMLALKRFLHINLPILLIWVIVAVLLTLRYKPAVFHNLICPFGALQKLFGKFTRRATKVDKNACIGCTLCENVCPSAAIAVCGEEKKANINVALCHQCIDCRQICPKEAIHYTK